MGIKSAISRKSRTTINSLLRKVFADPDNLEKLKDFEYEKFKDLAFLVFRSMSKELLKGVTISVSEFGTFRPYYPSNTSKVSGVIGTKEKRDIRRYPKVVFKRRFDMPDPRVPSDWPDGVVPKHELERI